MPVAAMPECQRRAAPQALPRVVRWGLLSVGLSAVLALTMLGAPRPRLVWNVSESAPVGLYAIGDRDGVGAGDMVLAHVPDAWRAFAAGRHYIPVNVPLVKRVAAVAGDSVCAAGLRILVNGREAARRRTVDGMGRPMPLWNGCVTLRPGSFLLLMENPASFDGRYFGPSGSADLIGTARPLWVR